MKIPPLASKIDLSNMGLTEIPDGIFRCKNLKKLNLSHNQIKTIPADISKLKFLKNLDISNNKIGSLMSKFFDLQNLDTLIVNNNEIKHIPKQIAKLKKLNKLSLAGNQLTELSEVVSDIKSLVSLNIANNLISKFPANAKFDNLEILWINKNPIQELKPKEILTNFPNLKTIYCFSSMYSGENLIDTTYSNLQKKKGNAINELKLFSLRTSKHSVIKEELTMSLTEKKSIFISYSHADETWLKEMMVPLKVLNYENLNIDIWDDTKIKAGNDWENEIEGALERAHIAILLVSPNFLSSSYVRKKELPQILENARQKGTQVIPIIARICRYDKSPLGRFQTMNTPTTPLNGMSEAARDRIYYDLCERIDEIINAE